MIELSFKHENYFPAPSKTKTFIKIWIFLRGCFKKKKKKKKQCISTCLFLYIPSGWRVKKCKGDFETMVWLNLMACQPM